MKKVLLAGIISTSLLTWSIAPAFADEAQSTQPQSGQIVTVEARDTGTPTVNTTTTTPTSTTGSVVEVKQEVERAVVKDIDPKVVEALRAKNFGYGKIALIVALSKKSGKTVDEVVKVLSEQKGIGSVAKALNIKMEDVVKATKEVTEKAKEAEKVALDKIKEEKAKLEQSKEAATQVKEEVKKDVKEAIERAVVKDVDPKLVETLRAQKLGYGKIALIAALAKKSNKSPEDIMKILAEKRSVAKVAKALNLKVGDVIRAQKNVADKMKDAEKKLREKIKEEKEKLERVEKVKVE